MEPIDDYMDDYEDPASEFFDDDAWWFRAVVIGLLAVIGVCVGALVCLAIWG